MQSSIPAGCAQISLQWSTYDNQNLNVTFSLTDGTHSYSVASDAYGMATQTVDTGGTYSISVTYSGSYDVVSTRRLTPESRESYIVAFIASEKGSLTQGTYGSSSTIPQVTVGSDGRISSITEVDLVTSDLITLDLSAFPSGTTAYIEGFTGIHGDTIALSHAETHQARIIPPTYGGLSDSVLFSEFTESFSMGGATAKTYAPATTLSGMVVVLTESGDLTCPSGSYAVIAWGGGGGGGCGIDYYLAGGGGGGGYVTAKTISIDSETVVPITLGAGGNPGTKYVTGNKAEYEGSSGGTTSFGSFLSASGGAAGENRATGGSGGTGGGGGASAYSDQTYDTSGGTGAQGGSGGTGASGSTVSSAGEDGSFGGTNLFGLTAGEGGAAGPNEIQGFSYKHTGSGGKGGYFGGGGGGGGRYYYTSTSYYMLGGGGGGGGYGDALQDQNPGYGAGGCGNHRYKSASSTETGYSGGQGIILLVCVGGA